MFKYNCPICEKKSKSLKIYTRSKKKKQLYICNNCDFHYFKKEQNKNLKLNKLDDFRLKNAGIDVQKINQEFINGIKQSKSYIKKFIPTQKKIKILDIGCSWGYFLYCCKKKGHNVFGLEKNTIRRNYVRKKLKIDCRDTLKEFFGKKFDKIFLFYSIEYIKNPINFIKNLKKYLNKKGEIIILTPNKNDHINNILNLKSYENFFYEENSINYFSLKSLKNLCKKLSCNFKLELFQGYSVINFFNWFYHQKPFFTGYVGKDEYIEKLILHLKKNTNIKFKFKKNLIKFINYLDNKFKKLVKSQNISNAIILKINW